MCVKISEALYRQDYPSIGERMPLLLIPSLCCVILYTPAVPIEGNEVMRPIG